MSTTPVAPAEAMLEFVQVLRNDERLHALEGEHNASRRRSIIIELGTPIAEHYGLSVKALALTTARMLDTKQTSPAMGR